ncbi:hypothetical protein M405DRAFT_367583 [Rhizopogon salebrosus TDB-379]|nr:hypothetical protein M405DRAFT_367583 [Rhizopogon salebrosus TDB-379]
MPSPSIMAGYMILVLGTNVNLYSLSAVASIIESVRWSVVTPVPCHDRTGCLSSNLSKLGEAGQEAVTYITVGFSRPKSSPQAHTLCHSCETCTLQLDDSPSFTDSPIAIDPPLQSTEFVNISRPSHPMPSRLVISLHPTQLTSYALAVVASMLLSVLVSITRLALTNIPCILCAK